MKKLLLVLLLTSGIAHAEIYVMPNNGGGEITLTTQTCKAENGKYTQLKHAYTWSNEVYIEGCWALIDGNVHITWLNKDGSGTRRVYEPKNFTKKETY